MFQMIDMHTECNLLSPVGICGDISDTTAAVLACLLEYLYTGELQLTRESVGPIQRLAEQLVIPGAVHQCELFNGNHVARSVVSFICLY